MIRVHMQALPGRTDKKLETTQARRSNGKWIGILSLIFLGPALYAGESHAFHGDPPFDVEIVRTGPSNSNIVLLPGQNVIVSWTLANREDFPVENMELAFVTEESPPLSPSSYLIESMTPSICGDPQLIPGGSQRRYVAYLQTPLPVGGAVSCQYRITRTMQSNSDVQIFLGQYCGSVVFSSPCQGVFQWFGYLPDFRVRITPVVVARYGDTDALVRIEVTNPSPFTIAASVGVCLRPSEGFQVLESDQPDACMLDGLHSGCLIFAPMSPINISIGSVSPEGVASCVIRLAFDEPLTTSLATGAFITSAEVQDQYFIDLNTQNNRASLGAAPFPYSVPVGKPIMVLLLLLVAISAWLRLRRYAWRSG